MGTVGLLKTMRCLKRQPLTNREQMSPQSLSTLTPAAIAHNLSALTRAVLVADKKKCGKLEQMNGVPEKKMQERLNQDLLRTKI